VHLTSELLAEELKAFLKKEKALKEFKKNLRKTLPNYELVDFISLVRCVNLLIPYEEDLIGTAFDWEESKYDKEHWKEINNRWLDYCKKRNFG